jgi:hypothetical protein
LSTALPSDPVDNLGCEGARALLPYMLAAPGERNDRVVDAAGESPSHANPTLCFINGSVLASMGGPILVSGSGRGASGGRYVRSSCGQRRGLRARTTAFPLRGPALAAVDPLPRLIGQPSLVI